MQPNFSKRDIQDCAVIRSRMLVNHNTTRFQTHRRQYRLHPTTVDVYVINIRWSPEWGARNWPLRSWHTCSCWARKNNPYGPPMIGETKNSRPCSGENHVGPPLVRGAQYSETPQDVEFDQLLYRNHVQWLYVVVMVMKWPEGRSIYMKLPIRTPKQRTASYRPWSNAPSPTGEIKEF
jgi:hypothetical protein